MVVYTEYFGHGGHSSGTSRDSAKQETESTQDLVLPDRGKQEPSKVRALVLGVFTDYTMQRQDFKNGTADVLVHKDDRRNQIRIEYPRDVGSIVLKIPVTAPRGKRDQMWDAFVAATKGPKAQAEVEPNTKPHALIKVGRPVTREDVLDVAEELFGTRTLTQSGNVYRLHNGDTIQVDGTRIHVNSSAQISDWRVLGITERLHRRVVPETPKRAPMPAQSTHPGTSATFRSGVTEELHGAETTERPKRRDETTITTETITLDFRYLSKTPDLVDMQCLVREFAKDYELRNKKVRTFVDRFKDVCHRFPGRGDEIGAEHHEIEYAKSGITLVFGMLVASYGQRKQVERGEGAIFTEMDRDIGKVTVSSNDADTLKRINAAWDLFSASYPALRKRLQPIRNDQTPVHDLRPIERRTTAPPRARRTFSW